MPTMTRKELINEIAQFNTRRHKGELFTKENLDFGIKATNYTFFSPYASVGGFALGAIMPLVISPLFALMAAIAVMKSIYHVVKALIDTDHVKENLKTAAAYIPLAFALTILTPLYHPLALLALVTSSIATVLSNDKNEDEAPTESCSATCV